MSNAAIRATVVTVQGRRAVVELGDGSCSAALVAGRRLRPVCGDQVLLSGAEDDYRLATIKARRGCLWRHDSRAGRRLLAAHVDRLMVVVAPRPPTSLAQLDRYLAIAALLGLDAVIVRNKADLAQPGLDAGLGAYPGLGYPVIQTSTKTAAGMASLAAMMGNGTSAFVGLSGVGKSSLIDALLPNQNLRVGALSAASGGGRHTTTATWRYRLPNGGAVVDSPGVRDIRLWPVTTAELLAGFVELAPLANDCRFRDCGHAADPGCAVREAAATDPVSARRYASFRTVAEQIGAHDSGTRRRGAGVLG